jgi:FkbM family methyltransferase
MCEDLQLKNKVMIEVGSYAGESTEIFAQFCKTVYAIDPWLEGMSLSDGTVLGESLTMHSAVEKAFDKKIKKFTNINKLKDFDYNVINTFEDESIDFIYIDALHTEEEMLRQIDAWLPKIKKDGILGGHDYCEHFSGIKRAVDKKLRKPDKIYNDDGNSWVKYKKNIIPLHFIVTGNEFGYLYYISVLSAIKMQNVTSTIIWMTENVKSDYLELLKDKVQIMKLDSPVFPALIGQPDYFIKAHTKDYFTYKILYENGGICLDLDTISVGDITGLLGDKDMVVPSDAEHPGDFLYHYNSAILVAKKESPLLLEAMNSATKKLNQTEDVRWGMTGPILISEIVFGHNEDVFTPEFRVCGGYGGYEIENIYKDNFNIELDPKVKVIHLYAVVSNKRGKLFDNVNSDFVKNSNSLLARTIKNILSESEWNPQQKFFVEIGSNYFDTLVGLAKDGWKGLIVEPVPEYFDKIERVDGVIYENVAIGPGSGDIPFFYIPQSVIDANGLPAWARGLGSFKKIHPIIASNKWEHFVKEIDVVMMTVEGLLEKHGVKKIDYLKIDTEGYDCEILKDFDLDKVQEVLFEHKHCPKDSLNRELGRLNENNFDYSFEGDNIMAKKRIHSSLVRQQDKTKFRLHLLGMVHLPQHKKFSSCAFTQKNRKLAKMLTSLGHEVFFYGSEGSDVEEYCDSDKLHFIQTHTLQDIANDYGDGWNLDDYPSCGYDWRNTDFRHDFNTERKPSTLKFYGNVIKHINEIKKPDDFFLNPMGQYFKVVSDGIKLFLDLESGAGYRGSICTPNHFRCFESAFLRDFAYGSENPGKDINGNWYDRVIPNFFDPEDFEYSEEKGDYYLYIGRMISRKGVDIAVKTCAALNKKLIIAGQGAHVAENGHLVSGDFDIAPATWEYAGFADATSRKKLMSKAIAVFVPTIYQGPFEGVNIEARLSGSPVLTTNFAVFSSIVENGVDGFRCDMLDDFIWGAKKCVTLDKALIRKRAERYLMDFVKWDYQQWFEDLHLLYESTTNPNKKGWNTVRDIEPEFRKNLFYNKT